MTLVWAAVVVLISTCALGLAQDLALILEQLSAPPVAIAIHPPTLPPARHRRPAALSAHPSDHDATECRGPEIALVQELEDRAHDLRLRNQHLRKLLEREAQAARYRAPTARPSQPASKTARAAGRPPLRSSTPRVILIGSDAQVTATVRNLTDRDLRPRVEVELLRNGRSIRRRSFSLRVPARATAPFSQTFPTSLADGTYSATVLIEP